MPTPLCSVYESKLGATRPLRHIAPQIRAAGFCTDQDCGTVAELTSNYYSTGRSTPDFIKSIRRGGEVGRTCRHYGRARDPPVDETLRHGIKSVPGEGVRGCMQSGSDRMTALMDEQLERMYLSNILHPLGRGPSPLYKVPVPRNGFGITSKNSESVKRVVYGGKDVEVLHPVGEHKNRGYDWERTGIDPVNHRFGKILEYDALTAADVMRENRPVTTLVPKLVKDYQATVKAELGKPRRYGFNNDAFAETMESKNVSQKRVGDGDAARELIGSWAQHPAVLQAQEKAAVALTMGPLTLGSAGKETDDEGSTMDRTRFTRTFGGRRRGGGQMASIELVDDVRAPHLLYPCHYVQLGVDSKYFAGGRTLEDVRGLCNKVNMGLSDEQINEVFGSIAHNGLCGIEQFKNKAVEMGYLA